jgi:hypothetical protein
MVITLCSAASLAGNTSLHAPPRFDGAGYAMLADALATGRGYWNVALPEPTRHTHFPPGYPTALAALWSITGRSLPVAHLFSCACTVAATMVAWLWFRCLYPCRVALLLGLALAANWTWARSGGAILSEPMFLLLGQLALLAGVYAGRRGGIIPGIIIGALLAACALTRHVGLSVAGAVGIDLLIRRRGPTALGAGLTMGALLLPWVGWLILAGAPNQASLLALNDQGLLNRITSLAIFYLQRLPDQLTGPLVEIGTVFQHRAWVKVAVNTWATVATGVLTIGLLLTLRIRRRRIAGLTAFATLTILLVWPFTEAGRFLIPLVPCLLVGAVEGLAPFITRCTSRRARSWAAFAVLAVSLPYATYAIVSARAEAQRRTYRDFDAACAWIARDSTRSGPVLARHPGEIFWLTGRRSLSPSSDDPTVIDESIDRFNVAFLLIDEDRYVNSQLSPLSRYVACRPNRLQEVWRSESGSSSVVIYARDKTPDNNQGTAKQ